MLLLLLLHIIISILSLFAGCTFYSLFTGKAPDYRRPLIFYAFSGLVFITLLTQLLVLIMPINLYAALIIIITVALVALFRKKRLRFHLDEVRKQFVEISSIQLTAIAAVWIMLLIINSGPMMMDDSESYHIQMTKWINEYGTVPGIVNLHERFGFNSSWFSSIAFFYAIGKFAGSYAALNTILSLWFCAYLITELSNRSRKANVILPLFLLLLLGFFCWPMIRGNAATANYDLISGVVIAALFIQSYYSTENKDIPYIEWMIWPAYLFTVRIINYPLLLLSLFAFILFMKRKNWGLVISSCTICLLLIGPFIARTVMIAGYPFYPSTSFDYFNVDWKTDPAIITELMDYIKYYNRVNVMYQDLDVTRQLTFPGWLSSWFHYLFYYDKPLVIAAFAGFVFYSFLLLIKKRLLSQANVYFIAVLILYTVSWLFIAPDPRFAYGSLLCGAFLFFTLPAKLNQILSSLIKPGFLLLPFAIAVLIYAVNKPLKDERYRYAFQPMPLPQPPTRDVKVDSVIVHIPEKVLNNWNARCFDTDLPCLYIIRPGLEMRGKSIRNGFRLKK